MACLCAASDMQAVPSRSFSTTPLPRLDHPLDTSSCCFHRTNNRNLPSGYECLVRILSPGIVNVPPRCPIPLLTTAHYETIHNTNVLLGCSSQSLAHVSATVTVSVCVVYPGT